MKGIELFEEARDVLKNIRNKEKNQPEYSGAAAAHSSPPKVTPPRVVRKFERVESEKKSLNPNRFEINADVNADLSNVIFNNLNRI